MRLLTTREAAKNCGVSYWHMRGLIASGGLPIVRIGRSIRIDIRDLEQWVESNKERRGAA